MNQTIKERLILFVKHLGMAQTRFEKHCGLANGYINNIRKSISPDKLELIALCFPELNTGWLMTGEGEMLKTETESPKPEDLHLNDLIKAQAETINSQKLLISTLLEKIEGLQRTVSEFQGKSV
jgi:transcriptional regulator with XRE-family HTH domain